MLICQCNIYNVFFLKKIMAINSSAETVNIGKLNGHTLILKMLQTMLRVERHKKNKNGIRLKGFNPH